MRVPPNRLSRILAFVVPTAVAMTLAACGNVTGPGDTPRAQKPSVAVRAAQLVDSTALSPNDSIARTPVQPWY